MRILTCLHTMEIGGTQLNAIELAHTVARLGHELIVFGPPGELTPMVAQFGLEYVEAPPTDAAPSLRGAAAMVRVAKARGIDLVHAHFWPQAVEAGYGPYLRLGTPTIVTIYSPEVPQWAFPRELPIIVGTAELAESERRYRPRAYLIEPPVDTVANAPVADLAPVRARFGIAPDDVAVFVVCRLSPDLKREGLLAAARAFGGLDPAHRLRLFIVGDGPCRAEIQDEADRANARAGREVVTLTGQMIDPRDAYAAADVMLGMGGSALRAMAFAKPLVVQGEQGFWRLLTPQTLDDFLEKGWYGLGDGSDGAPLLAEILDDVMRRRGEWAELGALGRSVICSRFSLDAAGKQLEEIYQAEIGLQRGLLGRAATLVGPSAHLMSYKAERSRALSAAIRPLRAAARTLRAVTPRRPS